MNSNNIFDLAHKGFRATIGATASLIESLQDPIKREENLALLTSDVNQLVDNFAAKGEVTEEEGRKFVDSFLGKNQASTTSQTYTTVGDPDPNMSSVASPDIQLELQELTIQIAAIRTELENLRNPDSRL